MCISLCVCAHSCTYYLTHRRFLAAENARTLRSLEPTRALQNEIYEELLAWHELGGQQPPEAGGDGFVYYSRVGEGGLPIYCRTGGVNGSQEKVLLDHGQLATLHGRARGSYADLGMVCCVVYVHTI